MEVIQPFRINLGTEEYQDSAAQIITSMFNCWNQAFGITGFLGHSPNINPACCSEQREG